MSSFVLNDLEKLSTAELHALAQQYPYFAGVRSVLAKRENTPQHLQQASWLSADRNALKQYLEQPDATENKAIESSTPLSAPASDAVLVTGDIVEAPIEIIAAAEEVPEAVAQEEIVATITQPEIVTEEVIVETIEVEDISTEAVIQEPVLTIEAPAIVPVEEEDEEGEEEEPQEVNTNQNLSFDDWLKNFSIGTDKKVVIKKEESKPAESEEKDAQELNKLIASSVPYEIVSKTMTQETQYAKGVSDFINTQKTKQRNRIQQSIAFDGESPITETYAILLVGQKKYERAIEVYERLILKFPAKSTYFAAQIEKLKTI